MMRLPRPASPRALWKDIKAFASERRPHQWLAAMMAIAIPAVIIVTFAADTKDAWDAPEQIIYVESWSADRSMEETRANIEDYERRRQEAEKARQESFQRLEAGMNKLGIN